MSSHSLSLGILIQKHSIGACYHCILCILLSFHAYWKERRKKSGVAQFALRLESW